MSFADRKEFVIKDVFTDVLNMEKIKEYYGRKKIYFGIPWEMHIYKNGNGDKLYFYLKCLKSPGHWLIDTEMKVKLVNRDVTSVAKKFVFASRPSEIYVDYIEFKNVKNHIIDGKLTIEIHVKVNKMTGIHGILQKLRSFDDESAKKYSDVALIVNDEKFYVNKMYLASHSSYFESLFMGNFDESKQSEITLNDIDPFIFQKFLEVLHGEPAVNEDTVFEILHLADMYDSKTAIRRCEEYLVKDSEQSLKDKFGVAIKYKMDELTKKCVIEVKTKDDIESVFPENVNQMEKSVLAELLSKALSLIP